MNGDQSVRMAVNYKRGADWIESRSWPLNLRVPPKPIPHPPAPRPLNAQAG